jgi:CRISPR-associated protein Cas2
MRTSHLICYDICDDKRLRKVFQTMRGYEDHLQYSVFECQLTSTDLARCADGRGAKGVFSGL